MSKQTEGKYEPTLVYKSFIEYVARVRRYGIDKHGHSEEWRTTQPIDHYDAIQRHVLAVTDSEWFDIESGLPHLAHAAANCMFEIERHYGSGLSVVRYKLKTDKS